MFGMSMPEILLILAVALIVIGPKKLPDLARSLGKGFREFRSATRELKESIDLDPGMKNIRNAFDGIDEEVRDAVRGKPDGKAPADASAAHPLPADTTDPPKDRGEPEADPGYQEALQQVQEAFKDGKPESDETSPPKAPSPASEGDEESPGSITGEEVSKEHRNDG
jgi:TatA/E family protein of Tat protein translocase